MGLYFHRQRHRAYKSERRRRLKKRIKPRARVWCICRKRRIRIDCVHRRVRLRRHSARRNPVGLGSFDSISCRRMRPPDGGDSIPFHPDISRVRPSVRQTITSGHSSSAVQILPSSESSLPHYSRWNEQFCVFYVETAQFPR